MAVENRGGSSFLENWGVRVKTKEPTSCDLHVQRQSYGAMRRKPDCIIIVR
jgi:hypothetical protein